MRLRAPCWLRPLRRLGSPNRLWSFQRLRPRCRLRPLQWLGRFTRLRSCERSRVVHSLVNPVLWSHFFQDLTSQYCEGAFCHCLTHGPCNYLSHQIILLTTA